MTARYGCHGRRDYVASYPVQDGHYLDGYTRTPRMVSQPTFGKRDCQFTLSELGRDDARCEGCGRKELTKGAE